MREEGKVIAADADSLTLNQAIKKFQKLKGFTADGKIGNSVVKKLNFTDKQKFNTIA